MVLDHFILGANWYLIVSVRYFKDERCGWIRGVEMALLLEGIITLIIGIAAFYLMVPSAVQTKLDAPQRLVY